jgi:hypothetical protein
LGTRLPHAGHYARAQDPCTAEELLEDIYDGLEMLRESGLLSVALVGSIAGLALSHLKVPAAYL